MTDQAPDAPTADGGAQRADPDQLGIDFVDVLFALVVAEILEPLRDADRIISVGQAHLVVAAVLTLTSWVGYHYSSNRQRYKVSFDAAGALPLLGFALDIGMVLVYWLTAINAEVLTDNVTPVASARPEVLLVAISFVLYVAWDFVGLAIRKSDKFPDALEAGDKPKRRAVTGICLALAIVTFGAVFLIDPSEGVPIVAIDAWLVALLIGFRVAKQMIDERPSPLVKAS